jgi:hypothetical protein
MKHFVILVCVLAFGADLVAQKHPSLCPQYTTVQIRNTQTGATRTENRLTGWMHGSKLIPNTGKGRKELGKLFQTEPVANSYYKKSKTFKLIGLSCVLTGVGLSVHGLMAERKVSADGTPGKRPPTLVAGSLVTATGLIMYIPALVFGKKAFKAYNANGDGNCVYHDTKPASLQIGVASYNNRIYPGLALTF